VPRQEDVVLMHAWTDRVGRIAGPLCNIAWNAYPVGSKRSLNERVRRIAMAWV
jgi:hypothetical protein